MSESDLLKLADLNLVQYWCDSARWMPGSEVLMQDDTVLINSALDFPGCSAAFGLAEAEGDAPDELVKASSAFFHGKRKYFSLILRAHAQPRAIDYCHEKKIYLASDQPGLVLDEPLKVAPPPAGAKLRWVQDAQGVTDLGAVVAQAYLDLAFPAESSSGYFKHAERVLNAYTLLAVVYERGAPVCTALAMLTHGIAGIYWVGTVKEARGKGLAEYCVGEVGNAAFDLGARKVVLQASHFGEPIYRRMGYREFTRYPWFICSSRM